MLDFSRVQAAFHVSRLLATRFSVWSVIRKKIQGVLTSFSSALAFMVFQLNPFQKTLKRPVWFCYRFPTP